MLQENVEVQSKYECLQYLNLKKIDLNLVQMSNIDRLEHNSVIFNFDEVGCGKTLSAIMCVLSVIHTAKEERIDCSKPVANILILAPSKLIASNIYDEFCSKVYWKTMGISLHHITDRKDSFDCSELHRGGATNVIITHMNANIFDNVSKKVNGRLRNYNREIFDLIVIDEADRLVCNTRSQNEQKGNRRSDVPLRFAVPRVLPNGTDEIDFEPATQKYNLLAKFRTKKILFMTASPIRYDIEQDIYNYEYIALSMLREAYNDPERPKEMQCLKEHSDVGLNVLKEVFGNDGLINSLYGNDTIDNEDQNTVLRDRYYAGNATLCFKEMAKSLVLNASPSETGEKQMERKRIPEQWDFSGENDFYLRFSEKLKAKLKEPESDRNRIVIFVKYQKEGKKILEALGCGVGHPKEPQTTSDNIKVHMIFGLLGNTNDVLTKYKITHDDENNPVLPDILILSEAIGNVGINLPAYNYIVNLHIPAAPSDLEQRFGRIDRYNSERKELHCCYVFCPHMFFSYTKNFLTAVNTYLQMTVGYIPTKNVLLTKEILEWICEETEEAIEEAVANGKHLESARSEFAAAILDKMTRNGEVSGKDKRGADRFNLQAILDKIPDKAGKELRDLLHSRELEKEMLCDIIREGLYNENTKYDNRIDILDNEDSERVDFLVDRFNDYRSCLLDQESFQKSLGRIRNLYIAIRKAYEKNRELFNEAGTIIYRPFSDVGKEVTTNISTVSKKCYATLKCGLNISSDTLCKNSQERAEEHLRIMANELCQKIHDNLRGNGGTDLESITKTLTKYTGTQYRSDFCSQMLSEYKALFLEGCCESDKTVRLNERGYLKLLLECVRAINNGELLQWNDYTVIPALGMGMTCSMRYWKNYLDGGFYDPRDEKCYYIDYAELHGDVYKGNTEYTYLYFIDDLFGTCSEEQEKVIKHFFEKHRNDPRVKLLRATEILPALKAENIQNEEIKKLVRYFSVVKFRQNESTNVFTTMFPNLFRLPKVDKPGEYYTEGRGDCKYYFNRENIAGSCLQESVDEIQTIKSFIREV